MQRGEMRGDFLNHDRFQFHRFQYGAMRCAYCALRGRIDKEQQVSMSAGVKGMPAKVRLCIVGDNHHAYLGGRHGAHGDDHHQHCQHDHHHHYDGYRGNAKAGGIRIRRPMVRYCPVFAIVH